MVGTQILSSIVGLSDNSSNLCCQSGHPSIPSTSSIVLGLPEEEGRMFGRSAVLYLLGDRGKGEKMSGVFFLFNQHFRKCGLAVVEICQGSTSSPGVEQS